ncbi:MAG: hypothetical protein HYX88_03920 [Chloroflexi bacterium]|nr:hypothetical protein [Chloroflexota bacterium]
MIVRILAEGQYRLDSRYLDELNAIDNRLVEVVAKGDEEAYGRIFAQMMQLVRQRGEPVPSEELVESDVVLPAPDITLEEAQRIFVGRGLVPG